MPESTIDLCQIADVDELREVLSGLGLDVTNTGEGPWPRVVISWDERSMTMAVIKASKVTGTRAPTREGHA